ncbi:PTS system beta-glucoside-specific IIA component, Glc family /PTS system beta-glucoside-specific IIB component, Glc family /PTS system beta-glucoside-specific IIC component, Glc family [Gracilibacillus ureilyticus]|uniref:PTS system beta-glucoside-specific IIA component, Glc family /PTS system beta-glucoside-specific IIB component, Glc family /PTS system beta-glucoside-specific IIC component, Glc family n=1 Tax=Gracilibacillus ureilyticus TaxID=531814 RepID=A0A1H9T8R8_9BACI|nr:beta-glucoside-specific PTS transporter subunit IIABC [Gracilibacillus ureilyticus]SER93334.1 PTS system beta-glucoside-specific IIA component, Glc family /PTS system beta-glucoside-specific IIB component, Glc family /PTS system beta-glucoside-specific IIC component, Glc family [Gracilibacillus ureilyticus]
MNYEHISKKILTNVGGSQNINNLEHCMTRLRFNLKDDKLANKTEIENTPGVMGVMEKGGQFQVIIGNDVKNLYKEFVKIAGITGEQKNSTNDKKQGALDNFLDTLAGVFTPILPAIVGAGMIKGLLSVLLIAGYVSEESQTYQIFNALADGAFYFLPVLIAFSASKKFGMNPFVGVAIAGAVLYPSLTTLMTMAKDTGENLSFLGLPVTPATYSASVIPMFLTIWFASYIEKITDRYTPNALKIIIVPTVTLLIAVPVFLIVIGPIGAILGKGLATGVTFLFQFAGPLAGLVLGAVMPLLVMIGMHYALVPIIIESIATNGYDYILPILTANNIAQGAAAFAVFFIAKNKKFKSLAFSTGITGMFGVTEPAMYGVNLRLKKPFIAAMIGSAAGSAFMMIFDAKAYFYGKTGIQGIPMFIGETFIYAILGSIISIVVAIGITLLLRFDQTIIEQGTEEKGKEKTEVEVRPTTVFSPMKGIVKPVEEVDDITFSSKIMGEGIAIEPTQGRVVSPVNGTVTSLFNTNHAIGLTSDTGVELLVHVGLDTVKLGGEFFESHVKQGDEVSVGDLLIEFDLETIKTEGYDIITPIIVTNSKEFTDVTHKKNLEKIDETEALLELSV